jgi:hypothetical protein
MRSSCSEKLFMLALTFASSVATYIYTVALCKLEEKMLPAAVCIGDIDISQFRLLFGFFLLYTDRVPFELLDSAAIL